ncbi:outer membrane protein assembly factor BamC [Thalassotalea sp. M1531]|uniref:Outer membrane protein assembly factor BamC n=1 Tax=Thalassotalea algicola TaxID=2716224 RepID=A0A7Y0LE19_9GAMM|nr:outer membrane protein assembly factor BamC [Thalassotalea algicola]NMP32474.1 outer membrane protein assembly factor BamC [Thalassotalea algicola]
MSRRSLYLSILALSIVGCSSGKNNRASGDFEYTEVKEQSALSVPDNLSKPVQSDDFSVVAEDKVQGPIGAKVDVRAPSLVLPVAASSRVIPESSEAIIWFDKVLEDRDLLTFIKTAVKDQLIESEVAIRNEDANGLSIESDWFHSEKESGVVFKDTDVAESKRFRFDFTAKPHGRSVSLQVTLVDYMKTDQSGSTKKADIIDKHRSEMALLNEITSTVDYKYRLQQRENRLMRANQKLVTIGENPVGEPAYIVEMEADLLWSNLPIFFENYGFDIADLNESKKIYYVDFTKPSISLWDKIWGDDVPVIELGDERYQFVLADIEDSTALTIYNSEGKPVTAEVLEAIFPVMEPALSFRDF